MKNILFLAILLFSGTLFSQDALELREVFPPTPSSQELVKYGEYPVGMYTGVPNISIPIHVISDHDIKVPISLTYHASGILVDQVSSWVGLGWSLKAGGSITKSPRGLPDESQYGYLKYEVPELNEIGSDFDFCDEVALGERDTESDIYHYNFNGNSGSFFFDRDKKIRLIEEKPDSIKFVPASLNVPSKFIIIDNSGLEYEFDEPEISETGSVGEINNQEYTSTWHLTKIKSNKTNEEVVFNYEAGSVFSTYKYNYRESVGVGSQPSYTYPSQHELASITSQSFITNRPKRLKEILFSNGKVVFNRVSDRLDVCADRLDEIIIYQNENTLFKQIRKYKLEQDYFTSTHSNLFPVSNPSSWRRQRLRLTMLKEFDSNSGSFKKHDFEYDATMLPPIETNGKDFWGYYNGKNGNETLIPDQGYQIAGNNVGSADRQQEGQFMKAGILNKIIYPTGWIY